MNFIGREEAVVRQVERDRLLRQLKCHYLKDSAWDSFTVPPRSLAVGLS